MSLAEEEVEKTINGFGRRVNNIEVNVGQHAVRIERSEKDVQEVWSAVGEIRKDVSTVKDTVNKLTVRIALIVGGITVLGWLASQLNLVKMIHP